MLIFYYLMSNLLIVVVFVKIGVLLFLSNIGSGSFVGLVGIGVVLGIVVVSYEFNVSFLF